MVTNDTTVPPTNTYIPDKWRGKAMRCTCENAIKDSWYVHKLCCVSNADRYYFGIKLAGVELAVDEGYHSWINPTV